MARGGEREMNEELYVLQWIDEREDLIEHILKARTPDEIEAAQLEANAYLSDNPDDLGVRAALEQLAIMRFAWRTHPYRGGPH
jgi:hypothetical protein